MNNQISIVIPTYNASQTIEATLQSIIAQSYTRWECIVVDDQSTDNTVEIVTQFNSIDQRIRQSLPPVKLKGANACRNVGLKEASNNWVMFVDADDLLLPHCLQQRVESLDVEADMNIFKTAFANSEGQISGYFTARNKQPEYLVCDLVKHIIPWHTMSPVWKKTFLQEIGGWNENYPRLQDVELNIRALLNEPTINFSNNPVDTYYIKSTMTIEKKENALWGFTYLIKDFYRQSLAKFAYVHHDMLNEAYSLLIEKIIKHYVFTREKRDLVWSSYFVDTLTEINLGQDDLSYVKTILETVNNDENGN